MQKRAIRKIVAAIAFCSVGLLSAYAVAGQDESQRQMTQQLMKAKQKLKEAEAAKGAERQKLMADHMKMMNDTMGKMRAMKPKPGMSMQEHEEWISEHQKLMEEIMGQMMQEHHMMMGMGCMPMGAGDQRNQ